MMAHKLKDSRGETLVELLASILIAALSVAVLFTCCLASTEMGRKTRDADKVYYEALSDAEARTMEIETGKVTVANGSTSQPIDVSIYGGDEMYSYQKEGS